MCRKTPRRRRPGAAADQPGPAGTPQERHASRRGFGSRNPKIASNRRRPRVSGAVCRVRQAAFGCPCLPTSTALPHRFPVRGVDRSLVGCDKRHPAAHSVEPQPPIAPSSLQRRPLKDKCLIHHRVIVEIDHAVVVEVAGAHSRPPNDRSSLAYFVARTAEQWHAIARGDVRRGRNPWKNCADSCQSPGRGSMSPFVIARISIPVPHDCRVQSSPQRTRHSVHLINSVRKLSTQKVEYPLFCPLRTLRRALQIDAPLNAQKNRKRKQHHDR